VQRGDTIKLGRIRFKITEIRLDDTGYHSGGSDSDSESEEASVIRDSTHKSYLPNENPSQVRENIVKIIEGNQARDMEKTDDDLEG